MTKVKLNDIERYRLRRLEASIAESLLQMRPELEVIGHVEAFLGRELTTSEFTAVLLAAALLREREEDE